MKKKLLAVLLVVTFIMCIFSCSFGKITDRKITDKNQYLQVKNTALPKFIIFPENLDNISMDSEYYHADYKYRDGIEVYLNAFYEKNEFEKEISRIEQISYKMHSSHAPKTVIKDNAELFNYVTYITVFNFGSVYEYACVDYENNRIIYIALYAMSYEGISFNKTYLPRNYDHIEDIEEPDNYKQYFSYNMYITNKSG